MPARTEFTHPILRVETFPVQGPDRVHDYVRLRIPDWVNVVAVTTASRLVLVAQHRYGIDEPTLEVPGGAVDADETAAEAAMRELREETGYGGGRVVPLGWVWVNPAIQDNRTWLFAALDVELLGAPRPDPTEQIEVVLRDANNVASLLQSGEITHSLAVVALQRALLRGVVRG